MNPYDESRPPPPRRRGPRPVPPGVPYHRVLADGRRRIWRGIAALTLLVGGALLFSFALTLGSLVVDTMLGRDSVLTGGSELTPLAMGATLLGLALLLPWSMLIQRWLYGVRAASLHSVVSRFRPAVFGRAVLVIVPVWAVYMTAFSAFTPVDEVPWRFADLLAMLAITLILVPLQSAGEEYGLRGLAFRVAASWGRGPRAALMIGVVVSSLLFMALHFAADPWLNVYYFTLGAALALITWRTGGLEAAIVIHAVNNMIAFLILILLRSDPATMMDRSVGTGSAALLVPCALLVAITAVVWWRTRDSGPALTPAGLHEYEPRQEQEAR
ncbi:CPBP family intramembrane glutamic endopeptidase [Nocardiopsis aegyptia]|uniref:Membrane protease YdiL (CAAX protease family) n=1 Tax=Nocardiopsis aegyptia TaxID=220378 RepID=A0A7Z0EI34_9ACTN|nr:CPBP family intramembrane glutamic endopeptidase [Nocardiopsis aegyptia]NYJ32482.1 membrane protease YdiL (CAAX protease family) [Nocardiopsis aegyptia]